jgi:hypothetical protein
LGRFLLRRNMKNGPNVMFLQSPDLFAIARGWTTLLARTIVQCQAICSFFVCENDLAMTKSTRDDIEQ